MQNLFLPQGEIKAVNWIEARTLEHQDEIAPNKMIYPVNFESKRSHKQAQT